MNENSRHWRTPSIICSPRTPRKDINTNPNISTSDISHPEHSVLYSSSAQIRIAQNRKPTQIDNRYALCALLVLSPSCSPMKAVDCPSPFYEHSECDAMWPRIFDLCGVHIVQC